MSSLHVHINQLDWLHRLFADLSSRSKRKTKFDVFICYKLRRIKISECFIIVVGFLHTFRLHWFLVFSMLIICLLGSCCGLNCCQGIWQGVLKLQIWTYDFNKLCSIQKLDTSLLLIQVSLESLSSAYEFCLIQPNLQFSIIFH